MKTFPFLLTILAGVVTGFSAVTDGPPPAAQGYQADIIPCSIDEAVKPSFPVRLLNEGVTGGEVHMLLYVDATGTLTDTLITAYSRKGFADEALRGLKSWKFTAGRVKGQPIDTIVNLTFRFEVHGVVVVQNPSPGSTSGFVQYEDFEFKAARVQDLDRVPTPLNIVEPTYPREWMKQGIVGTVAVDFYIDEAGRARFPVAVPATHEQLMGIALAAVHQWQFIPPKSKGQPVLVRARQVFQFDADDKP